MAKSYGGLYPRIYDFEALYQACIRARRGKRQRPQVLQFEANLECELIQLQNELIWGEYRTGRYHRFEVCEPKRRSVSALPFRDRVLQHSLVAAIEPIWERRFSPHSYACRPGRGTHAGADAAQRMLREVRRAHGQVYALKADIGSYFASVDHGVLLRLIERRIRCPQTLTLCREILASHNEGSELAPRGIPIGNLTSQLWANVYLHELDMFVTHQLKHGRYVRYMDDFVLIGPDKAELQRKRLVIEDWLQDNLRLATNSKTQVFPVADTHGRALDFLGYRIWPSHRRLRKSSIARIKRSLRRLQREYAAGEVGLDEVRAVITSWLGHATHADADGLVRWLLDRHPFSRSKPSDAA